MITRFGVQQGNDKDLKMLLVEENWQMFMLNSKVIGDQHGASVQAYCGVFGNLIIAGYGRWRDTVTPYAYGISDFLNAIGDIRDEPDNRLYVMPKNKAVRTYVENYGPLWRERGVNGQGEAPSGLIEWIRVADEHAKGRFLIGDDFKVFKEDVHRIDNLLDQIGTIAKQKSVKEGEVVRVPCTALKLEGRDD